MKILHVTSSDCEGGAAIATLRLHRGLKALDINSVILTSVKSRDDVDIVAATEKWPLGIALIREKLDSMPVKLYSRDNYNFFSPAIIPDFLHSKVTKINPDIIHLHWIGKGFLRLESLQKFNKPIVWTLHDAWAFTGGCHLPFECTRYNESCGMCPALGSKKNHDLSHKVWKRKKKAWGQLNLTTVAPSKWLSEAAKSSSLFRNFNNVVIPHGIDINLYKPIEKKVAREILGFSQDKKLILFGAINITLDRNKGYHLLLPALQKLVKEGWRDKAEIVVFGLSEHTDMHDFGLKSHYMGYLHDDISLALLYAAADVTAVPSIQEAFGQIATESLSCGTPVVAFRTTGLLDIVDHKINGYLTKPNDTNDLACGIKWILEDNERAVKLGVSARKKVVKEFTIDIQAQQYSNLYAELLSKEII